MKPGQSVGIVLSILHSVPQCHVCTIQFMEIERHFPMKAGQSVGIVLSILHSVPQCHVCTIQFMEMEGKFRYGQGDQSNDAFY